MYHYIESGLTNIYLKNGVKTEHFDGEEYTSINDIDSLHKIIGHTIVMRKIPLSGQSFRFLRTELNVSQNILGNRFGVSEQTIARYEKGQTQIPRTTDIALRTLYTESLEKNHPISFFIDLLSDAEAQNAADKIIFQQQQGWQLL